MARRSPVEKRSRRAGVELGLKGARQVAGKSGHTRPIRLGNRAAQGNRVGAASVTPTTSRSSKRSKNCNGSTGSRPVSCAVIMTLAAVSPRQQATSSSAYSSKGWTTSSTASDSPVPARRL